MHRGIIILIAGIAMIVAGSLVLNIISLDVQERYGDVVLLIPDQTIEPQSSYTAAFDLFLGQDTTLAVASRTPNALLSMNLVDIDGMVLEELAFDDKLLLPLDSYPTGSYQLTVTNFDERTVTVNAAIAPSPILEQLEEFLDLAYNTLAASAAVVSGLVVCVVGAVIWIKDKRRQNKK